MDLSSEQFTAMIPAYINVITSYIQTNDEQQQSIASAVSSIHSNPWLSTLFNAFLDVFGGETLVKQPHLPKMTSYAKRPWGCARHAGFRWPELVAEAVALGYRRTNHGRSMMAAMPFRFHGASHMALIAVCVCFLLFRGKFDSIFQFPGIHK